MTAFGEWRARAAAWWQERLLPWYAARGQRERRLLLIAGITLPIIALTFGVFLPLHDRVQSLRHALPKIARQAAQAERLARQIQSGKGRPVARASLLSTVERLSQRAGVRAFLTHIRPDPGARGQLVSLAFKQAPFDALMAFVHAAAKAGIEVRELRMQAAAPGLVHAQLRLAYPSASR